MVFAKRLKHLTPSTLCLTMLLAAGGGVFGNSIIPAANAAPSVAQAAPGPFGQDPARYALTFADHFEGPLDGKVWNTSAWYEQSNPTINFAAHDGALKIWPQRDANGKFFNRTIDTDGRFTQTYGYFEIEAKLPRGQGTWPAFWLFNHIGERRPEIDIMESYAGGPAPWGVSGADGVPVPTMYAPTIWKDAKDMGGTAKVATPDLSAGFHKYALKWEPNKQTFYFDGKEVYSANVKMSDPMYIMLDLWYGSISGQPTDARTPVGIANSFEVNYVKAWQFK